MNIYVRLHTVQSTRARADDTCTHSFRYSDKLYAIWQTVLQQYRRIPPVYLAEDFLIICTQSSPLFFYFFFSPLHNNSDWLLH